MHRDDQKTDEQRRKLVKLAATGAVVLPLSGLVACGGDSGESAAEKAQAAAGEAADKAAEMAESAAETVGEAADAAADAAGDAMDAAGEMASDAADAAGDAVDAAGEMASDAVDAAGDMASDAKEAMGEMADDAAEAMSDAKEAVTGAVSNTASGLPKLEESDPVAQALGYKHDASAIDASKYEGRGAAANEYCKNCALFVDGGDGWGACSIFVGKAVNQNGWCASYNRKG
ncbi:MAG: high-potential iron-sulfur protein [Pseudomonadota bacterium]